MGGFWKALALTVGILAVLILFAFVFRVGYLLLLVLSAVYGWMLFAFLYYRQCRQEELLQVISAAAEAEAPLLPALQAYLNDRPQGRMRAFWVGLLLTFVVPGAYWLWYRRSSYDRKVEQLIHLLEAGDSLLDALQDVPGVASHETLLAVALGEKTGQLARCLQSLCNPARSRLATLWLEMVPRVVYPLFLLLVMSGILMFWTIYIAPKYERIFNEFAMSLPVETERAMFLGKLAVHFSWILALAVPLVALVLVLLLVSPGFRWQFPVVGYLYQSYLRSQILQALSFLLQMNEPAPAALAVLAESGYFVEPARRRLNSIRSQVEQGEPLADSLHRGRILPRAMVPLLRSAERVGNLPWALAELADVMAQRTAQRVQRLGLILFPIPVLGLGVVVGIIVIGLFVPVVSLIERLSQ